MFGIYLNAAAGGITSRRALGWDIPRDGYGPIFESILPYLPGRRFMIHNPYGRSVVDGQLASMEFDQWVNCQKDIPHVVQSYEEFLPKLKAIASEVIHYIGIPRNSPRMVSHISRPRFLDNWLWQWWRNLRTPLEYELTIAFDNLSNPNISEFERAQFRALLESQNRPVLMMEACPEWNHFFYDKLPIIVNDARMKSHHQSPQHPGGRGRLPTIRMEPLEMADGRFMQWYSQPVTVLMNNVDYQGEQGLKSAVKRIEELTSLGCSVLCVWLLALRLIKAGY